MKKLTILSIVMMFCMLFSAPSFAFMDYIDNSTNADATAGADASLIFAPTTIARGDYAPGHMTPVAPLAYYTGSETPGYTYQTFKELLTFGNVFTESQLRSMAGDRGIRNAEVDITMMDSNMARQKPTIHPTAKERTIAVFVKAAIPKPIRRGAFITVAMKSVKGISVECLGKAGVAALEVGANSLFVTAEGLDITQSQHSVSVGPGISFSSIGGSDGSKGVTGGGGLAYSYGVFGKNYKPFQRFMALYVEDADHKYALKGEPVQK
jgi:hypothetical protein